MMQFFTQKVVSQNYKIEKYINDGQIELAMKQIEKSLKKDKEDPIALFYKSQIFVDRTGDYYSPDSAYIFLWQSRKFYNREENKKKLNKFGLTSKSYRLLNDTICWNALLDAKKINSVGIFDNYLKSFQKANPEFIKEAKKSKRACEFLIAINANHEDSLRLFIEKYRRGNDVDSAWASIHVLKFREIQKTQSMEQMESFLEKYPLSRQYEEVRLMLDEKEYVEYTIPGQWETYMDYIASHEYSEFFEQAEDSLLSMYKRTNDSKILRSTIDYFRGTKREDALRLYHDFYVSDGELVSLDEFYEYYDDEIFLEKKEKEYEIARIADKLHLEKKFDPAWTKDYNAYIRMAPTTDLAFVALQRLISHAINREQWNEAIQTAQQYTNVMTGKNLELLYDLLELLQRPKDPKVKISFLGDHINTANREYLPSISADDQYLYFVGRDRQDNLSPTYIKKDSLSSRRVSTEDVFVCKRKGKNKWGKPVLLKQLSTANTHDAVECMSVDLSKLLVFRNGKLYLSEKTKDGWSPLKDFPMDLNFENWQADAVISSDGKAIVFSAISEENYNTTLSDQFIYHGNLQHQTDIYVIYQDEKGEMVGPINLGPEINTRFSDRTPFLHPDMQTLYFSSDGHGGFGNKDMFVSRRLSDTCWTCWSKPENLGKEFNGPENDMGYTISTDGETAYFSKGNVGREDLYSVSLPKYLQPQPVAMIEGKVLSKEGEPLASANIIWEDLSNGKKMGSAAVNPADGSYFFVLPMGKLYGYYIEAEGYFSVSNNIDLRKINSQVKRTEPIIRLLTYKQMKEDGVAFPVKNLFFQMSDNQLSKESEPELKRLASILSQNNLQVEIIGHTDAVGSAEENMSLSLRRALAVKEFLVKNGCTEEQILFRGEGANQPIAKNDTEVNRAKNRRVEIKIR